MAEKARTAQVSRRPDGDRPQKDFVLSKLLRHVLKGTDRISSRDSSSILSLLEKGDLAGIKSFCERVGEPLQYGDPDTYFQYAQLVALLKKYPYVGAEETRAEATKKKFFEAEATCRVTNDRFKRWSEGDYTAFPIDVIRVLYRAREVVKRVLGSLAPAAEEIFLSARHGPGTSLGGVTGDYTTEVFKYTQSCWFATASSQKYLALGLLTNPLLPDDLYFETCEYNKVTAVPKDAWSNRLIAIEPSWNVYLQLGVGRYMASRLLSELKVDLTDQTTNTEAAFWASVTGEDATIDLRSASDTISIGIVSFLLSESPDWLGFLEDLRSPGYQLDGCVRPYEKWSSMGNGFTFPLETLIFYAIACGCADEMRVSIKAPVVYGDDIIVPTEVAPYLIEVLAHVGFATNPSKTFCKGPFRESCGSDFWYGIDVRPFYLDFTPRTPQDFFYLINNLLLSDAIKNARPAVDYLLSCIPLKARMYGPYVEDFRAHIFAPIAWLYNNGYVRYRRQYHCMEYQTSCTVAIDLTEAISSLWEPGCPLPLRKHLELARCKIGGGWDPGWLVTLLSLRDLRATVLAANGLFPFKVVPWPEQLQTLASGVGDLSETGFTLTRRKFTKCVNKWVGLWTASDNHDTVLFRLLAYYNT